jgi:NADPH:quinone reductase-like Zn-dependent oxidoreductase
MRAIRFQNYGPPSVLALEEVPTPEPGPGEVLVKVSAAGINRADVGAVAGAFKSTTPRVPGRDFTGVIVEGVDSGLEVWGSGERMGIDRDGAHAEFVTVPRQWLVPKPRNLSMPEAAGSGVPFIVAYEALIRVGRLQEGETLLLTGAEGAVGRAATQLAHRQGAKVIGVQRSSNSAGTDYVIDIQKEALHEAVQALTRGVGADIVLDAVGGDLFEPALKSLRVGGRQIAIASLGKRRVEFDLIDFYHNVATLHGVDSFGFSGQHAAGILDELRDAFEHGELKTLPTDETLLDHAAEAYETVKRGTHQRQVLILKK